MCDLKGGGDAVLPHHHISKMFWTKLAAHFPNLHGLACLLILFLARLCEVFSGSQRCNFHSIGRECHRYKASLPLCFCQANLPDAFPRSGEDLHHFAHHCLNYVVMPSVISLINIQTAFPSKSCAKFHFYHHLGQRLRSEHCSFQSFAWSPALHHHHTRHTPKNRTSPGSVDWGGFAIDTLLKNHTTPAKGAQSPGQSEPKAKHDHSDQHKAHRQSPEPEARQEALHAQVWCPTLWSFPSRSRMGQSTSVRGSRSVSLL